MRAKHYRSNEVFALWGDDFDWMNAEENFYNLDSMISYMNEHYSSQFTFRYSTPSDYV